jgi:hypothetical protein
MPTVKMEKQCSSGGAAKPRGIIERMEIERNIKPRKYIETRARLFASIPPRHKYIRHVNRRPAAGVKPLFTDAFFCALLRAAIE